MYIFLRGSGLFGRLFAWLKAPFRAGHDQANAPASSYAFPATLFLPRERVAVAARPACNDNKDVPEAVAIFRGLAARLATVANQNVRKSLVGKRAGRCAPAGKAIPKRK